MTQARVPTQTKDLRKLAYLMSLELLLHEPLAVAATASQMSREREIESNNTEYTVL